MSAFGNLSGGDDFHVRAMRLNADKLMELATRPAGQVKTKEVAMASIFYGKFKAHYYSLDQKREYTQLYNEVRGAYDSFLKRVGVVVVD